MDTKIEQSSPEIVKKLLAQPKSFNFYQAIRLLNHEIEQERLQGIPASLDIVPWLSLAFPETDIEDIKKNQNKYILTATFLSLFGTTSPLPTFYTEQLIQDEFYEIGEVKYLLNIIHKRLYDLMYGVWSKNRIIEQFVEHHNREIEDALFGLIGLALTEVREKIPHYLRLLKYSGHWINTHRSLNGLRNFLTDFFKVPIEVKSFFLAMQSIPYDQRCHIGHSNHQLNRTAYLGSRIRASSNNVLIRIGPLNASVFPTFLIDSSNINLMQLLLKLYVREPFNYMMEVILDRGSLHGMQLSSSMYPLGVASWLAPEKEIESFTVRYWLKSRLS
ncbi:MULTISPECIES: type VI secretion system baseplate subunit TssG [Legionella]|uniref:type VI secretion system baseplate subunit TssG n=1 Tax=Legionella TaxID=445 RepID=UPI0010563821|nr:MULTISPECIES: type VI secretion system baseplate subunit TssG [Legionella]MCE3045905.1 type VI secretion system baseplate subunit TssG [Legionella sp. 16cNR16C]